MVATNRGKVVKLKQGDCIIVGRTVVKLRSLGCELYVYGQDEIISKEVTHSFCTDTKEQLDKLLGGLDGMPVDEKDL